MSFLSKELKREIRDIVLIILCWSAFNTFFFQVSFVPSGSMRSQLLVSDIVVVSKLRYGARIPRTLALPFLEKTLPWTKIPSYIPLPIPYWRLPGLGKMKRGDVVVFNTPTEPEYPIDHRQPFVKRIVGLWGDRVAIEKGKVWVNGKREEKFNHAGRKMRYFVETSQKVYSSFFKRYDVVQQDVSVAPGGYLLSITADIAEKLQQSSVVVRIKELCDDQRCCAMQSIIVPKRGMTITIDAHTCEQYGKTIRLYEGHDDVVIKDGTLWINGEQIMEYTFRLNYLFVLGDNFFGSWDSRFWGFVPVDHVLGKAIFILLGGRDGLEGGEEWWRRIWLIPLIRGHFTWKRSFRKIR
ncbi:MAG: signal peptidase I [Bacteroidota bacterium]